MTPEEAAARARGWSTNTDPEAWAELMAATRAFSPDEMHAYILAAGGDAQVAAAARAGRQLSWNEREQDRPTTVGLQVVYTLDDEPVTPERFWAALAAARRGELGDHVAVLRADAATALLDHYETTHGDVGGHDHHCPRGGRQDTDESCTCGWQAASDALTAYETAAAAEATARKAAAQA